MLNKTYSLEHSVYLVGLHIYYKMIHGPYNIKLAATCFGLTAIMGEPTIILLKLTAIKQS